MTPLWTRRQLLQYSGAGLTIAALGSTALASNAARAKVESVTTISKQRNSYHGWPTLARRKNGQLWVVCSGGRETHVCPFGRVEAMTSDDDGRTWTWPRVLLDGAIDDRDAGVLETAKGSLLVTTFTSLAYEDILLDAEKRKPEDSAAWPAEKLKRWQSARDRLPAEQRKQQLGVWMLRSANGGISWSAPYRCLVNSPHGPIQLSDGRVLYAGKELWHGENRVGVCESFDDGKTWRWLATIPARPADDHRNYHELHAVEAGDGRIIVQIRNHNAKNSRETLQTESTDGGKTWTTPHTIGVWGLPSHLLRLKDGRLLMSYGHRRRPYGNQARISSDQGRTWSEPLIISADGAGGDLGYPSTVELGDGSLLSVWYEKMKDSSSAVLRQARWRIA
jgi:hypothetical protein